MHLWPFDTITPEQFDLLTDEEKQALEAALIAYLAEIKLRR